MKRISLLLLLSLEHDTSLMTECVESIYMKLNKSNCQLLMSGYKFENILVNVGNTKIWDTNSETILGIQIEKKS